ncbi:MAG TPA: LAGLIDADG family homing endonuclease, partial [Mycobacterium sp.]|nr:LAGLIDADG family homing endonuclease [Mycobacterium sp.]
MAAQYECLAGDTRVWTAVRGHVPIKEIEPGDLVFAYDEEAECLRVAPVNASAQTDIRQTYKVRVGTREIRATDNHPFLCLVDERKEGRQRARFARKWKTLGELKPGDLVAVPRGVPEFGWSYRIQNKKDDIGPIWTTPDLMWLLGFFLGDGNLQSSGKTHRVQFAVPETDAEVRAEITRIVNVLFGLKVLQPDPFRVVINSKSLVEWFQTAGFYGNAHTKVIPNWVFQLPLDQRLAFLGGWVDADGYVGPARAGAVLLTSVNQPLLEQGRQLAELCGLRAGGPYEFSGNHPFDPDRTMYGFRLH